MVAEANGYGLHNQSIVAKVEIERHINFEIQKSRDTSNIVRGITCEQKIRIIN